MNIVDIQRYIGIGGFALILGPFGLGLASAISASTNIEEAPAPIVETRAEPSYLAYGQTITNTFPQWNRSVAISVSFMMTKGTKMHTALADQIASHDGRLEAVMIAAINAAGDAITDPEELRRAIPESVRRAINVHLGTDDDPTPCREVLITSYAFQ